MIANRSVGTTPQDIERATETLGNLERGLIRRERGGTSAPFTNVSGIIDDAGGGMAFVPAAYASGFVLASGLLHGTGIAIGAVRAWRHGDRVLRALGGGVALVGAWLLVSRLGG